MGTVRKLDVLGRMTIPKEWRDHSGINPNDDVIMKYDEDKKEITVRKHSPINKCVFCDNMNPMELNNFKDRHICDRCIEEVITNDGQKYDEI